MIRKISLVIYEPSTDDVGAVLGAFSKALSAERGEVFEVHVDVEDHQPGGTHMEAIITKRPF